jgi:acyl-homoserine-lactone acylase
MKKIFFLLIFIITISISFAQTINPQSIDIVRDSFGVPHIFAKTDAEVAYGLAWAEAEDDFKSMQMVVLPAKGLMGKVLGKQGAAGDYAFELFRCREITEEKWNTLSPEFIKLITGYVQAINDYAKKYPEEVLAKKLFPVTLKEYISSSVLALTVFNGADNALKNIFNNTVITIPQMDNKGSNSIAIHPAKTQSGEAFLAINAHQPNTGPQSFYEAHICSEEGLNVLGGLLAGGPCILHGVNENLGWAHTVNFCDRLDVYQLEMNPADDGQYKFDGEWMNLEKKVVKLKIKGVPVAIKRNVYWSKYGATMKNKQGFFSIRLGANMEIRALEQWYKMNKAKNFTEFYAALSTQGLSMFNIMYADRYDTIFYINNALMPVRDDSPAYNWKQTLPGNTSKTLWTKFRGIKELPQYINPKSGFLFNTNHSSFLATAPEDNLDGSNFPKMDGWETWNNNRSVRLEELIPQHEKLGYEAFKKMKFDRQLPKKLAYPYALDSLYIINTADYPQYTSLLNELKNWDGKGDADSKGAGIFLLAYNHLSKLLAGQALRKITMQESIGTYKAVYDYMMKNFGKTDLVLGDILKLVRGNNEFPLSGFPDLLSPQWTEAYKNGTLKSIGGDGYIAFVRFRKDGLPLIESVNMYGASAKPGNKHFDDQVPLYLQQKTKKMTLDKTEVYKNAERIYHPGQ